MESVAKPNKVNKILCLCLCATFTGLVNASSKTYNLEQNIGLYQVIEKTCQFPEHAFNPCTDIRFIELVKGRFFGIKNTELALVFWSDSTAEKQLSYEAREIRGHGKLHMTVDKVWVENKQNEKEFFSVKDNKLFEYQFILMRSNKKGEIFSRKLRYVLKKVSRKDFPNDKLSYPED